MKDINTIQADPRFAAFQELACALQKDYGVKVWHSNVMQVPEGIDPDKHCIVEGFYKPLERFGYNLDYEVYCYGSPKEELF